MQTPMKIGYYNSRNRNIGPKLMAISFIKATVT